MGELVRESAIEEKFCEKLDCARRCFVSPGQVELSWDRNYQYCDEDRRILKLVEDEFGVLSDMHILYAIAFLGASTMESIAMFLTCKKKRTPSLELPDVNFDGVLRNRIRAMAAAGLIYSTSYKYTDVSNGVGSNVAVTLYSVTDSAYQLINQVMQTKLVPNIGFIYKHISEMMGWASGSYIGAKVALACGESFNKFLDRELKTKQMGVFFYPCEFKTVNKNGMFYVATMFSFMERVPALHSEDDFNEICARKINFVKNYLACRTQKGTSVVIVVVRDSLDLERVAKYLYRFGEEYLDRIYFTGEGVFRYSNDETLNNKFVKVICTENGVCIKCVPNPIFA